MNNINNILTTAEKAFIKNHNLSYDDFYDGRFEKSQIQRHDNAKKCGCNFVIGPKCHNGHRLKTRNGHCIECDSRRIIYKLRHEIPGAVYVATCGDYCKIGMVQKIGQTVEEAIGSREYKLNTEGGYGGNANWQIIDYREVSKGAGKVEHMAQAALSDYRVKGSYCHSGCMQSAYELFRCDPDTAIMALNTAIDDYTYVY